MGQGPDWRTPRGCCVTRWVLVSAEGVLILIYKIYIIYKLYFNIIIPSYIFLIIQLSLIFGSLIGTIQNRIKRLITYSSINNIGNLLIGIIFNINILNL